MATTDHDVLDALYGEPGKRGARADARKWPAGDPRHAQLAGLRDVREALSGAADGTPDPPAQLHRLLMTEAALELRLRETEGLADDVLEADGTRRRVRHLPNGVRSWWQAVAPGQWVMLASAAMLLLAVTIGVGGLQSGARAPGAAAEHDSAAGYAMDDTTVAMEPSANSGAGLRTNAPATGTTVANPGANAGLDPGGPPANTSAGPPAVSQPEAVTAALVEQMDGRLARLDLGQWTNKGGTVDLDSALHDMSAELGATDNVVSARQKLEVVWSVYRHKTAGDEQRQRALELIADNGIRLGLQDAELAELGRSADQLLYDQYRPAWFSRAQRRLTPPQQEADPSDPIDPGEGRQQRQEQQNEQKKDPQGK